MNHMLLTILWLSLSGSLFILLICLSKPIVRHKLSKNWQYYIWLVVIARLLLPFSLEVNLLGGVFEKIENTVAIAIPQQEAPNESLHGNANPGNTADETLPTAADAYDQSGNSIVGETQKAPIMQQLSGSVTLALSNLWLIWLVGALILMIRKITIYQSFIRYVVAGRIEVSDIEHLELFGKIAEQHKIKQTVGLYTNSLISSPLLIGFFMPCIILPTTELSDSDFRNTILHELTHYKRMDMFFKWLAQLAICLHWFNPLVYLMGREMNRACELSCDEAVISKLDAQEQKSYGDTLLNALAIGKYNQPLASLSLNEGKEFIKERLDSIMKFKKQTRFGAVISIALAGVLCFGAAATGAYAATTPISPKDVVANQTPQSATSVIKPPIIGNLTLVEQEYTMDDIKSLNISGLVVEALSENVSITRGGKTLKIQ